MNAIVIDIITALSLYYSMTLFSWILKSTEMQWEDYYLR